ncbi:MAG TPA: pitrilysin family protein [Herpetosiphonaceae bacterium]
MAKETIIHTVLSSGLQIKLKQQAHQRTVNLGVFISHGTQDEDLQTSGAAHFIEHVVFNPNYLPQHLQELLNSLLEAGVSYEAATSKEYTRFMLTCLPKQIEQVLHALSLLVSSRHVSDAAIEHERPIILHEHAMHFSSSAVLKELLDHALWGDHSLGLFVIGRKENILRFDRQELEERLHLHYVPERTSLVALGPIDVDSFVEQVDHYFEPWESSPRNFSDPIVVTEPRLAALPTNSSRIDLLIGYVGVPSDSRDRYAMDLLADILGGDLKSRLFVELREKQKLAYLVHAYPTTYALGGYLAIRVNCNREDLPRAHAAIQQEIARIKADGVNEAELARVKASRTRAVLMTLENSPQHLQLLGRRATRNDDFFVDLETRRIETVQAEDIVRLAEEIFIPKNIAMVGFGPQDEELLQLI